MFKLCSTILLIASLYIFEIECFHLDATTRDIVGGSEAELGSVPYHVAILYMGSYICSGSIYSDKWILTAGHCVNLGHPTDYVVVAGVYNLNNPEGTSQTVEVIRSLVHPNYNEMTLENDIGLLELKDPLMLDEEHYTKAIQLAPSTYNASGLATVSGFGRLGSDTKFLLVLTLPIVTDEKCREWYVDYEIANSMLCAGWEDGGRDICGGGGAPLVCQDNGFLCGIFSWGTGCAMPMMPSVHTEVAAFTEWIRQNAN